MNPFSWNVLDGLLRGTLTASDAPRLGRSLLCWQIALAAVYGLSLGLFALSASDGFDLRFMLNSAWKLPVLIIGSTLVTFPSLYVLLALFDVKLGFQQVLGGMLAANTIFATVIASMGPIIGFFSLSSHSYPFILLLNVAVCGLGGVLGMRMVLKTLAAGKPNAPNQQSAVNPIPEAHSPTPISAEEIAAVAIEPSTKVGGWRGIIGVWMVLYVFVGTQLAWILRPFIGNPDSPFVLFRGKSGSFVDTVIKALGDYLNL